LVTLTRVITHSQPTIMERRYPYLDRNLVEFLTSIPLDQLLRPGQRRFLMRRALAGLLPTEILARKTKAGAGRCYVLTLEKHWDRIEEAYRSPLSSHFGYINADRTRQALLA